ncbi:MAG: ATPase [Kiritimatiellia bacterium]|nr:ATPase [Kiritimatiellia bacterium]
MAEELQYLIERIRKEAIEKSQAEADRILAQAKEKAAALVKEAEAKAKARLESAETDSQKFVQHAERTLEQAARDLLISVGQGVENILRDIVAETTKDALDLETVRKMMLTLAQAYSERDGAESRIEFLVPEKEQEQLVQYFSGKYAEKLAGGITVHAESGIHQGFRISLTNGAVSHDFTREAVAESLSGFLRPHLAEIIHRAARGSGNGADAKS